MTNSLDTNRTPTQVAHPWRSTLRTVTVAALALLPILPSIVDAAGIGEVPVVAAVLSVTAAITRVMAIPAVEDWLQKFIPALAAQPGGRHTGGDDQ